MKDRGSNIRTTRQRDPELMAVVATNIRRFREENGWTQEELRKRVGWESKTIVSQLENCKTGVGPQTLRKLANVFLKDPSEFYQKKFPDEKSQELPQIPYVDLEGSQKEGRPIDGQPLRLEYKNVFRFESLVRESMETYGKLLKAPLPVWPVGRENHKLIWAIVDKEFFPPEHTGFGDIVCIDCDDKPDLTQTTPPGIYAVRLQAEVKLCRLEIQGRRITLRGVFRNHEVSESKRPSEDDITIDLRGYPSAIIGRVLWVMRPL